MNDPRCNLLSTALNGIVARMQAGAENEQAWADAGAALVASRDDEDIELFVAIEDRDEKALRTIVQQWSADERPLARHDRDVLKRALKAFRKRLRVVRLDSESSVGGGPMSSGRESHIVGVRAPDMYPQDVWDELVRQNRLVDTRDGVYELPPE